MRFKALFQKQIVVQITERIIDQIIGEHKKDNKISKRGQANPAKKNPAIRRG